MVFWPIRLNAFRLRRHSSIRRGPRTEHVRGLLQRRSILNSLCWRVLHCVSNQPVHIWLPRAVARKNNHGLTRNPREPSDWQAVGEKTLSSPRGGTAGGTAAGHRPRGPANHRPARSSIENPPTDKLLGEKTITKKMCPTSNRLYSTSFVKTNAPGGLPSFGTAVLIDLLKKPKNK